MSLYLQVKAATGEQVSAEDLGGADLHCKYEITASFSSHCISRFFSLCTSVIHLLQYLLYNTLTQAETINTVYGKYLY